MLAKYEFMSSWKPDYMDERDERENQSGSKSFYIKYITQIKQIEICFSAEWNDSAYYFPIDLFASAAEFTNDKQIERQRVSCGDNRDWIQSA